MTRLLKTPIVARAGTASISSCIDKLGGESMACTLRMPPDFCAKLGTMPNADTTSAAARFFGLLRNACDDSLSPIILAAQRDGWVFSETKDDRHEARRAHARVDWKNSLSIRDHRLGAAYIRIVLYDVDNRLSLVTGRDHSRSGRPLPAR